ncbi:predicted protein [Methanosarcina acetivorans C2A]|uniref:Uncharacterized protein n=1 Tax=Methanosarcina acetivorans (strain ATCC 35395 / DSM 2834 / JCM 12185 / C2A) TaxID=188937 RepID=Q8TQD5_METAC|nr:predicted protein [Methanosarcina acetivorans C2A]
MPNPKSAWFSVPVRLTLPFLSLPGLEPAKNSKIEIFEFSSIFSTFLYSFSIFSTFLYSFSIFSTFLYSFSIFSTFLYSFSIFSSLLSSTLLQSSLLSSTLLQSSLLSPCFLKMNKLLLDAYGMPVSAELL